MREEELVKCLKRYNIHFRVYEQGDPGVYTSLAMPQSKLEFKFAKWRFQNEYNLTVGVNTYRAPDEIEVQKVCIMLCVIGILGT
jgi:hypothetical protein